MRPPVIISSHAGRIGSTVVAVLSLGVVLWDCTRIGLGPGLRALPTAGLFVWLAWLFWGLSSVRIDDEGVHVINQLRIWDVPWAALTDVSPRWGLSLTGSAADGRSRTVSAWAAGARGSMGRLAAGGRSDVHTTPEIIAGAERPVRVSLDAADAAHLIELEKLERVTDDSPAALTVHPNWMTIGVSVLIVVAALLV
ncbi:hypothetical protein [Acidipropionibacterium timonense]|uniref:hypothetical protein n=1 Tax=Acidipropionibacterium timonense TaxID=2161818 RepID=UPI001031B941|nr:hypothetical protein [Acidipropionibacterium timonense]